MDWSVGVVCVRKRLEFDIDSAFGNNRIGLVASTRSDRRNQDDCLIKSELLHLTAVSEKLPSGATWEHRN